MIYMELQTDAAKDFSLWVISNPLPGKRRRGSKNTVSGYVGDLDRFARWFEQSVGKPLSAETLTPDDIQDFISKLQVVDGKLPSTVLRSFAAIRAYCLYLQQTDNRIVRDLTDGIRLPKKDAPSKRGLRRTERLAVERVFNVTWKNTGIGTMRLIRDHAIISVLMYVGLRVDELINLALADIEIGERSGTIYVRAGKGNQDRTAGIPAAARRELATWMDLRARLNPNHDKLFIQIRDDYKPLGTRAVQRLAEKAGQMAGLEIALTPHVLRHTAVRIWRKQSDDRTTAAQMGHSVATMQRYDAIKDGDVKKAAARF